MSSFACAIPGIMATRTIENPKDRLATIMIAPFMSCSARLPVYTLMIAAFFAGQTVFGFLVARRGFNVGDVFARNFCGNRGRIYFETNDFKIAAAAVRDGTSAVSSAESADGFSKYADARLDFSQTRRNGYFSDFDNALGVGLFSAKRGSPKSKV